MSKDEGRRTSPPGAGRPGDRLASATLGALRVGRDTTVPPREPEVVEPEVVESDVVEPEVVESDVEPDVVESGDAEVATDDNEDAVVPVPLDKPVRKRSRAATADTAPSTTKRRRRTSRWTAVCALVAFLALAFAVVTGVLWWTAGHSHDRRVGLAREQISTDARLDIVTVNTSDYRTPSAALDNWLRVSTGSLHSQFGQSRSTAAKLLGEAKMITKATVLDAAVTDVNLKKGEASVIASVNVTRTPVKGSVSTVRNRFRATMTRVGSQWKLSDLTVVPVSLS